MFSEDDSMSSVSSEDNVLNMSISFPDGLNEDIRFSPDLENRARKISSMDDIQRFYRYFELVKKQSDFTWEHYINILLDELQDVDEVYNVLQNLRNDCDTVDGPNDVFQSKSVHFGRHLAISNQSLYSEGPDNRVLHSTAYSFKPHHESDLCPVVRDIGTTVDDTKAWHTCNNFTYVDQQKTLKSEYYSSTASPAIERRQVLKTYQSPTSSPVVRRVLRNHLHSNSPVLSRKSPMASHKVFTSTPARDSQRSFLHSQWISNKVNDADVASWKSGYTDLLSLPDAPPLGWVGREYDDVYDDESARRFWMNSEVGSMRSYKSDDINSALRYCMEESAAARTSLIKKIYEDTKVLADDIYRTVKVLSKKGSRKSYDLNHDKEVSSPKSRSDSANSSDSSMSSKLNSFKKGSKKRLSKIWSKVTRKNSIEN